MMKIVNITLLLASVLIFTACHAHPRHPHDGHFCPPGQAKKGNC